MIHLILWIRAEIIAQPALPCYSEGEQIFNFLLITEGQTLPIPVDALVRNV